VQWAYVQLHRARLARYRRQGLIVGDNFVSYAPLYISDPYVVRIGHDVSIAPNVHFVTHDAAGWHLARIGASETSSSIRPIVIHDDCGIGYGAIILPGVSIGPRSIVGAGSVVRSDVPPDTVVLGNPARVATSLSGLTRRLEAGRAEVGEFLRGFLLRRWPGRFGPHELTDERALDSSGLGLDSVEMVEVVLECEERYGVRLPEELLTSVRLTIGGLIDLTASSELRSLPDLAVEQGGA
jgi:acyl carrier protein